ncbi:MAG: hypothetical protein BWY89_01881 [Bacteroidetes bacterium ADurb.BinA012]|nr:MAG: hypothetical protein BWY89_01881 [Bacteroidetes bacterium ADurb.BinA012]
MVIYKLHAFFLCESAEMVEPFCKALPFFICESGLGIEYRKRFALNGITLFCSTDYPRSNRKQKIALFYKVLFDFHKGFCRQK